jgi:hypothetical protein
MKKITQNIVSEITQMRHNGYSYKEISKIEKLSVGTVFNYTNGIKVTPKGLKHLKDRQILNKNKFVDKFARCKDVRILNAHLTVEKARIIGHCLFDGFASKYVITYTSASKDLTLQFQNDMEKEYLAFSSLKKYNGKDTPYFEVYVCSKIICQDIRKYILNPNTRSRQMLKEEKEYESEAIISEITRAFWEDE